MEQFYFPAGVDPGISSPDRARENDNDKLSEIGAYQLPPDSSILSSYIRLVDTAIPFLTKICRASIFCCALCLDVKAAQVWPRWVVPMELTVQS